MPAPLHEPSGAMARWYALALLLVWALAPGLYARAQDVPFVADSPRPEFLAVAEGLPTHFVTVVLQDHLGFLWIGTRNGLVKYDGYTFVTYRPERGDAPGIPDTDVVGLYEDLAGLLWVVTRDRGGRLFRFDRESERFNPYPYNLNLAPPVGGRTWPYPIHESPSAPGVLWIGVDDGLIRFDPRAGTFRLYQYGPGESGSFSINSVWSILEGRDGTFWIGSWGLHRFDPETGTFTRYLPDPAHPVFDPIVLYSSANVIASIYEDRHGALWVGTQDGLYRFDRETGVLRPFLSHRVWHIYEDLEGTLRAATIEGTLFRFARGAERFTQIGILPKSIHSLYQDRSGLLWIARSSRGLIKVDPYARKFQVYPRNSRAVLEDRQGLLWIGTGGGLFALDRDTGTSRHYALDPAGSPVLMKDMITAIHEDREGTLWIGSFGGLHRFDRSKETFVRFKHDPVVLGPWNADTILEDREGRLWVGGFGSGLRRINRATGRVTQYRHDSKSPDSLGSDYVMSLHEDRSGTLWIGTRDGLSRFSAAAEAFSNERFPGLRMVTAIREDRKGRLWVGGFGSGLHLLDREAVTSTVFTSRDGLVSDWVQDLLIDDRGFLWISTQRGLSRFDPETQTFRNFDTADGLPSRFFHLRSGFKSTSGELFFGTREGTIAFFPNQLTDDPVPPQVALTDFRLSGEAVPIGEESPLKAHISVAEAVTLPYDQRDFELAFAALSYSRPEKNRYVYRLEGYDDRWHEAGPQRTATYTNLDPGAYTFRVKASNGDGVWNEEGASLDLTIRAPWWRAWWAYALYLLAILSLVYSGYKWRVRRLERHALELRRMVRDRTRELAAEKKKTEQQAQQLLELARAKDRFFANLSHEFRTPLTLILGPLQDVLDGRHGPAPPHVHRQLRIMRRSGRRLSHLISELLDLTRLDVGRLPLRRRRGDLVAFLKDLVGSFAALAERRRVALQFEAEPEALSFSFDADKLEKVVGNLLSNALKFTAEGGKVRVGVREVTDEAGVCAEVCVRDTGRGIPPEALPHIFDRFYQVDASTTREHEGTGIGLALAKSLVTLHGGTIEVESREGFGSTFTLRIPCIPLAGAEGPQAQPTDGEIDERAAGFEGLSWALEEQAGELAADAAPGERDPSSMIGRPTILIVEDNADVRDYLKGHLAGYYGIVEAEDGRQGLEKTREVIPDLVISDVMMPEMDGVTLCRTIKEDERLNHVPVVLLTAKASEEAEIEGLVAGCDDYITKPFGAEALLARVENLIEIRRLLRQRFSGEVLVHPSEVVVSSEEAAFLERVRAVVEDHLGDGNFTVEWLADEVGLSPRQLRRRLRALVKLSPAGFIRMMRLERAAQLLAQHAGTVSEVAYAVGFHDAGYFAGLFRQAFGVLPSAYATTRA